MGFPSGFRNNILQSDLRLALLDFGSYIYLRYSASDRLQQLLPMQSMHCWLRKNSWRVLWQGICQESKRWKKIRADTFCLFFSASFPIRSSTFLDFRVMFISKSAGAAVTLGGSCI
jgi:hypothetical protein